MKRFLQYLLISFILGLFIVYLVVTAVSLAPEEKFLIISFVMSQHIVAILWFVTLQTEVRGIMERIIQILGGIHYLGPIMNKGSGDLNDNTDVVVLERVSFFPGQACKLRKILIKVKSFIVF